MPVRQTEEQLRQETEVASVIATEWHCIVDKLKPLSMIDRLCSRVNGNHVREYLAAIEIKCRRNKVMEYPTFFIDEEKVKALRAARKLLGVQSFIVVRWSNVTGWFNIDDVLYTREGGRHDRGDDNDVEMVCHYDVRRGKPIRKRPEVFDITGE